MKVAVLDKLLAMRQVLKLNKLIDMSPQSKKVFKIQTFMVTKKNLCGMFKKKEIVKAPQPLRSRWNAKLSHHSNNDL